MVKLQCLLKSPCRYVTLIKASIYYFLPLSIIGILYTLMAKKLQNSAREVQTITGYQLKNSQAQNRRHVARMVIVFILGIVIIIIIVHVFILGMFFFA